MKTDPAASESSDISRWDRDRVHHRKLSEPALSAAKEIDARATALRKVLPSICIQESVDIAAAELGYF